MKDTNWLKLGIIVLLVFIMYSMWGSILMYPFMMFNTYAHELSHGIAAEATGGTFVKMEVESNGSGVATTRGGNDILIKNAGYLGSLVIGCILLWISKFKKVWVIPDMNWLVIFLITIIFAAVTVVFIRNWFGAITAGIFIAILIIVLFLPETIRHYFLLTLALATCCNAVYSIISNVFLSPSPESDAAKLAAKTLIPTQIIGAIWLFVSFILIYLVLMNVVKDKDKVKNNKNLYGK
jgi:hypothetical protein